MKKNKTTPEQPARKIKIWQILVAVVAVLVLVMSLALVIFWGITGAQTMEEGWRDLKELFVPRENNVYYKDSYSVGDAKAFDQKDRLIATAGGKELTNGMLQVYYWMSVYDFLENYGYYAVYYGLDFTQPLDEQSCVDNDGNWQQFFLENALTDWHNYQSLALEAQKEGVELDPALRESLDDLRGTLTQQTLDGGFSSINAMLQADMGAGCDYDAYYRYMEIFYTGYNYLTEKSSQLEITREDLEAYFAKHEQELKEGKVTKDSGDLADVRHILITPEGGTKDEEGEMVYTDQEWEACRAQAQKILDKWLAGEKTQQSFGKLAEEYSQDEASNEKGGLHTNVGADSSFVQEFKDWCLDDTRVAGDYGLVKTDYGYHILYFCDSEPAWLRTCRDGILTDYTAELIKTVTKNYPMEVNYKNIVLGVVDLGSEN